MKQQNLSGYFSKDKVSTSPIYSLTFGNVQDGIYSKKCKPEHFMGKYQGFGISVSELKEMEKYKVHTIKIYYYGKRVNQLFESKIIQWINSNKTHVDTSRGANDMQKFVSTRDMVLLNQQKIKK